MTDGAHRRGHYLMFLTERAWMRKHTSAAAWVRIEMKRFNKWCDKDNTLEFRWWGKRRKK